MRKEIKLRHQHLELMLKARSLLHLATIPTQRAMLHLPLLSIHMPKAMGASFPACGRMLKDTRQAHSETTHMLRAVRPSLAKLKMEMLQLSLLRTLRDTIQGHLEMCRMQLA